jgi:hypothetical protein
MRRRATVDFPRPPRNTDGISSPACGNRGRARVPTTTGPVRATAKMWNWFLDPWNAEANR